MKNGRILLVGLMVVVLAAGVVAGVLAARLPGGHEASAESIQQSSLEEELGLSPQQTKDMRRIWEDVRDRVNECGRSGLDLSRQRDNEILALLNDDQKLKFEKIAKDYRDRESKLSEERTSLFDQGVKATKKILTKPQQDKYTQIIKGRLGHVPSTDPSAP